MPLKQQHISKAESNERLAETLGRPAYVDWAVTVLFYAALHYVDAVLAVSGIHPNDHAKRNEAIGNNATLRMVRPAYRTLQTLSRNARYLDMKIDPTDLAEAEAGFQTIRTYLRAPMKLPS